MQVIVGDWVARDLEVEVAAAQLTLTTYFFGLAGGQLLWGPLSDRFGRKPVLVVSLVLYVGFALACWAAPSRAACSWNAWRTAVPRRRPVSRSATSSWKSTAGPWPTSMPCGARCRSTAPARRSWCCSSATAGASTSPCRSEAGTMWDDRFVEVCRRHPDLVAVYESRHGRLGLLLRLASRDLAHGVGVDTGGWLHSDDAKQLQ